MGESVKNFTFSLPIDLLNKLKKYSNDGYVSSVNAAVKEALESYAAKIEKQDLFNQMKAAAQDPIFMQDLEQALQDFSYPDFEATKEYQE